MLKTKKKARQTAGNTPYFTKALLIEASKAGIDWDFNRQIDDSIDEVSDLKYPVFQSFEHHYRHGERCETHMRCVITINPFTESIVVCDVPIDFFKKLPRT